MMERYPCDLQTQTNDTLEYKTEFKVKQIIARKNACNTKELSPVYATQTKPGEPRIV